MCEELEWIEIGERATWWVNSAKVGNGVGLMRDERTSSYWQSDGHQPHLIDVEFGQKTHILEIQMYLDYDLDESYTPQTVTIRAGSAYDDLKDVITKEFHEPGGWQRISFELLSGAEGDFEECTTFKAKLIQIAIVTNHQSGRDSRVRQIKIFGPKWECVEPYVKYEPTEDAEQMNTPEPSRGRDF